MKKSKNERTKKTKSDMEKTNWRGKKQIGGEINESEEKETNWRRKK